MPVHVASPMTESRSWDADFCYRAMEHAAKLDVPVSLHEEDPSFIQNNGINHGAISEKLGVYGSPSIAEESLVARDCLLALRSGADVVIQHISSGVSVEMVRTFKALGAKIHAEATPHHFTLTDEALLTYGTAGQNESATSAPQRTASRSSKVLQTEPLTSLPPIMLHIAWKKRINLLQKHQAESLVLRLLLHLASQVL